MEILAVNENCNVIPDNNGVIENCCDLGYRPSSFSDIVNKPNVYKFKNFCDDCRTSPTRGFCDTITDKGGWLVVQRRQDGSVDFNRTWVDYEDGFGSLTGEFWYGLRPLHCLTNQGQWEMRIDFTTNRTEIHLSYSSFRVRSASYNYELSIYGYRGNASSDPFNTSSLHGMPFTTKDRDNDKWSDNCAVRHAGSDAGGWWYNICSHININHQYNNTNGMQISTKWNQLSFTEMKIRPLNCKT